jgi:hypothetical protein
MAGIVEKIRETIKSIDILPKVYINEDSRQEVSDIMAFVYANGAISSPGMPSKRHQQNILHQIYSWDQDSDYKQYGSLANGVYENAVAKENSYKEILGTPEIYPRLQFALEGIVTNLISIAKDKSRLRDHLAAIDNLSERLLLMNENLFKKLFLLLHEYRFWLVYNQDEAYKYTVEKIKKQLRLYHGIKQVDFYKKISGKKDDISYTLYFAEKAGEVVRQKDGRTYRLYLPEDNVDEIPKYEYTRAAIYDGDFNYKTYWKDIEKFLNKNAGILQTEFYSNFDYPSEIVQRTLKDAEQDEKVIREKKGNTYLLYLPEQWVKRER